MENITINDIVRSNDSAYLRRLRDDALREVNMLQNQVSLYISGFVPPNTPEARETLRRYDTLNNIASLSIQRLGELGGPRVVRGRGDKIRPVNFDERL